MADRPEFDPENLTEEELRAHLDAEAAAQAEQAGGDLSEELVRKWDPERVLRMVSTRAGRGERLDESTRRRYERRLGADLGDVRIYSGPFAEEVTRAHSADAVTIGTTGMILMSGSPRKSMTGAAGRALLAHELTHVAQEQRSVHRKAAFGEAAPLATEEHEAEAEEVEAEEMAGGADDPGEGESAEERIARLNELVRKRVLDMFAEDERVRRMRNGPSSWRP